MNGNVSYFRLGLFVLVGLALFIGALLLFGARAWFEKGLTVETYVDESVQGLDVGSPVKYRGVQVGKVTRIGFVGAEYSLDTQPERLTYGRYVLVEMEIAPSTLPELAGQNPRVAIEERVNVGLRMRIAQTSIAGPSYVEVDYVDPKRNPPLAIAWKPREIYIPSVPSTGAQIRSAAERIADQLDRVHFDQLFGNIQSLAATADKAIQQLQAGELSQQTLGLLQELRHSNQQLQALLGDKRIQESLTNLTTVTANLQVASQQLAERLKDPRIGQILAGLANTSENAGPAAAELRNAASDLQRILSSSRVDVEIIIRNLRQITANLGTLSEEAKQNPSAVLFGAPPPHIKPGG